MVGRMGGKERARDLGIVIGTLPPGPSNAITDVDGVQVGHRTLIEGEGPLRVGEGPVRTGVTVIIPRDEPWKHPAYAGSHRLNGNGELTGLSWVRESGQLMGPIGLTNTHSVGVVRDGLIRHEVKVRRDEFFFSLPVVGETCDGLLNDINGFHVKAEHVEEAIEAASSGPVDEGNVGGGTGMICHGFKGGIGTASRKVSDASGGYTVGVLVQTNHGMRERLVVNGVPVGRELGGEEVPLPDFTPVMPPGSGSIIGVVATDAPLIPTQCERLAQRIGLGIARMGGAGEHGSGELFFCFATGNDSMPSDFDQQSDLAAPVEMLANRVINDLFYATVEATEEAILNAMLAAETMTGPEGATVYALPPDRLVSLLDSAGRRTG